MAEHNLFFGPLFLTWSIWKVSTLPIPPGPCSPFSSPLFTVSSLCSPGCIQKLTAAIHPIHSVVPIKYGEGLSPSVILGAGAMAPYFDPWRHSSYSVSPWNPHSTRALWRQARIYPQGPRPDSKCLQKSRKPFNGLRQEGGDESLGCLYCV